MFSTCESRSKFETKCLENISVLNDGNGRLVAFSILLLPYLLMVFWNILDTNKIVGKDTFHETVFMENLGGKFFAIEREKLCAQLQ